MKQPHGSASTLARVILAAMGMVIADNTFAAAPAQKAKAAPITWRPCEPDLVDARWAAAIGSRLQCGTMITLLDADVPASGTFTVGLIRITAGKPEEREGSLFFNFGGPGANPLVFLPPVAWLWSTRSPDHPLDGDKRRLADRYDLVAVIPRGLLGGTRFACPSPPANDTPDPTLYLADWNWAGIVKDTRRYATGCGENSLVGHVGTLQHVRDMEHARVALEEPVMNFMGISYGTWVGAFYATMFPQHTGRIVLDSAMDFSGTFEGQLDAAPEEREALFARNALRPALANPLVYGIGSNAAAVMLRFRAMPYQALEAWASLINSPTQLVAALTLADWMRSMEDFSGAYLATRAESHIFSADPTADRMIRRAALHLASRLGQHDDPTMGGLVDLSVYHAVVCGDTPTQKDRKALRRWANTVAAKYPAADGSSIITSLRCTAWPAPPRWRPPLSELAKAPPLLMIQSEFDSATSYMGAMRAFNASPGAYMVLARDSSLHGLFGSSATPCVEHAVGHFLLTGEHPETRFSMCEYVPTPAPRQAREVIDGPSEHEVRTMLMQLLRHS